MKGIFVKAHVHSLHRDELLELREALSSRRGEVLEEVARHVGHNDPRALRYAGQVELIDDFVAEISTELDNRNKDRKLGSNDHSREGSE